MICRTLCEMMGGQLSLQSQPGVGTLARVQLQLSRLEPLPDTPAPVVQDSLPPATRAALHILVVDDSQANRQLLCEQLRFLDYSLSQAQNGAEAYKLWLRETFDVVITDCNMPVMNGYELTRQIRLAEQIQGRPPAQILGFTANVQPEEQQRCLDAGMNGCIFKPIALPELDRRLRQLQALPRTQLKSTSQRFDIQQLDHLTGGNPDSIQRVLKGLQQSNQQDLKQIRERLASADSKGVAELAHRIHGAARIIQAKALIDECEYLEKACREGANADQIKAALTRLEQAMLGLDRDLLQALESD